MAKRDCPLCGEVLEDEPAVHDVALCEKTERLKGRETIKKLRASVDNWKDAWYHQRSLIGELGWTHLEYTCPHRVKPVEESQPNVWLHPNEPFVRVGNLVYQREASSWKLVGSGKDEEAANAVMRLMSQ